MPLPTGGYLWGAAADTSHTAHPQGVAKTFSRMQELGMVPNSITFMELMVAFRDRDDVCARNVYL